MIRVNKTLTVLATLLSLGSLTCKAADTFERKPGLWKISMQFSRNEAPHRVQQCLAADTDARINRIGTESMKGICSKLDNRRVGNTYVTDSICKIGTHTSVAHEETVFDGDSAYRTTMQTHDDHPGPNATADSVYTQEGHWAGPCPSSMKPGDQIMEVGPQMPEGIKTNLLEAAEAARPAAR
jgi:hypothetical protein